MYVQTNLRSFNCIHRLLGYYRYLHVVLLSLSLGDQVQSSADRDPSDAERLAEGTEGASGHVSVAGNNGRQSVQQYCTRAMG